MLYRCGLILTFLFAGEGLRAQPHGRGAVPRAYHRHCRDALHDEQLPFPNHGRGWTTQVRLLSFGSSQFTCLSERKKWIHCFDDVMAVLFVAAINEYDQTCFEDSKTNRVMEVSRLFRRFHPLFSLC
jgi:hypothetical protein